MDIPPYPQIPQPDHIFSLIDYLTDLDDFLAWLEHHGILPFYNYDVEERKVTHYISTTKIFTNHYVIFTDLDEDKPPYVLLYREHHV